MKTFKQYLTESDTKQKIECDINGICKKIKEYESAGNEEKILSVYKDSKGLDTIGHGHLVTKESPKIFGELNISPNVLTGKTKLTPEQADTLLKRDVSIRIPKVKKLIPNLETYSSELQGELVSEYFRGMLPKSPKAVSLLNQGKFEEAAGEFINAKEYRESVKQKSGIYKRMDALADAIKKEGARQRSRSSSQQTTQGPVSLSTSQNAPFR
jgi:GH24 family phage-related lysozyme (muramidase)